MHIYSVFRRGSYFVVVVYNTHSSFFFVLKLIYKRQTRKRKTSQCMMNIHTCTSSVINSKIRWSQITNGLSMCTHLIQNILGYLLKSFITNKPITIFLSFFLLNAVSLFFFGKKGIT